MRKGTKGALVVFLGVVAAFVVVGVFDYTDSYVGDRFKKGVEERHFTAGETFSLDAFMEYYDWDSVCIVLPGSDRAFKTRAGTTYRHRATTGQTWSLVFVKQHYVVAEIPIERSFLAYPNDLDEQCFERWAAVFSINVDEDGLLRLAHPGN